MVDTSHLNVTDWRSAEFEGKLRRNAPIINCSKFEMGIINPNVT